MSATIDERVVQMEFDNAAFERKAKQTIKTLDKLEESLDLNGASRSLEEFQRTANSFSLSNLAGNIERISRGFSLSGIFRIEALKRLTNTAISTGKKITEALTVDPVHTGLEEYETQINAIQTILANTKSKGSTLDDVNAALEELNHYADLTIYNFTEMTRNIGTFTAAGIDLERSVSAIKGIANLGAISGSKSQQVSTAMYQLSQALAAGTVKLQDWNSVVNAGMGGEIFQESLKETARIHGIEVDAMIEKEGSFRESLKHGWITSEVLIETLMKFTGDLNDEQLQTMGYTEDQIKNIQEMAKTAVNAATKVKTFTQLIDVLKETAQSGWTESWQNIIGTFEEAQQTLTNTSYVFQNLIQTSSDARNELLSGWKDLGGRTALIETFVAAFNSVASIINPIKRGFRDIFPEVNAKNLYELTIALRDFVKGLQLSQKQEEKLRRFSRGLFSLLDAGASIISQIVTPAIILFSELLGGSGDNVLDLSANIGDLLYQFSQWIKSHKVIGNGLNKTVDIIVLAIRYIRAFIKTISDMGIAQDIFARFVNFMIESGNNIVDFGTIATAFIVGFIDAVRNIDFSNITSITGFLTIFTGSLKSASNESNEYLDQIKGKVDEVTSFIITAFGKIKPEHIAAAGFILGLVIILRTINQIGDAAESVTNIGKSLTKNINTIGKTIAKLKQPAKSTNILKIAIALGILAASVKLIADIPIGDLVKSVGVLIIFTAVLRVIEGFPKSASLADSLSTAIVSTAFAAALYQFAKTMYLMGFVDWWSLIKTVVAAGVLVVAIEELSTLTRNIKWSVTLKGFANLAIIGPAILILAKSLVALGKLDLGDVKLAFLNLAAIVGTIGVIGLISKGINSKALWALLPMALGMYALIKVLQKISSLNIDETKKTWEGIKEVVVVMLGVMAASRLAGKNAKSAAKMLTSLTISLNLVVLAMKAINKMTPAEIQNAIDVVGRVYVLFGAIVAVSHFAGENAKSAGKLLLSMSAAMVILTGVIAVISTFKDVEAINRAVGVIGAIDLFFTILLLSAGRISRNKNAAKGLRTATVALIALSGVMALMGILPKNVAEQGSATLIAVSGSLSLLIAACTLLNKVKIGREEFGNLILLEAAMSLIGATFAIISNIPANNDKIIALSAGVALLTVAMGAFLRLTQSVNVKDFKDFMETVGVMTAAVSALALALGLVTTAFPDTNNVIEIAAGASLALIGMSAACRVVSGIDTKAAIQGALGFAAFIGVLAAVLTILGGVVLGFNKVFGDDSAFFDNFSRGMQMFDLMGQSLGNFVGGLIKGVGAAAFDLLPIIGNDVSLMAQNLQPFFRIINQNKTQSLNNAKVMIETLLLYAATNFVNGMNRILGFGRKMKAGEIKKVFKGIGEGYKAFSNAVSGVSDHDIVGIAARSAETLVILSNKLPKKGGLWQLFTGKTNWKNFSNGLEGFGYAYAAFADAVSGIEDYDSVGKATASAESLAVLATKLPKSDGILQDWFGGNVNFDDFSNGLGGFGLALKAYSNQVKGVDTNLVETTANAALSLAVLANSLPETAGILQTLFGSSGNQSLSEFADQLIPFAVKFVKYSAEISKSDTDVVNSTTAAVNALDALSKLATDTVGDISLSGFGSSLVSFGEQFATYCDDIAGADIDRLDKVTEGLTLLKELCTDLVNPSDGLGFLSVKASLYELGTTGLDAFVRSFTDGEQLLIQTGNFVASSLVAGITNTLNDAGLKIKSLAISTGKAAGDGLGQGMDESNPIVEAASRVMSDKVTKNINFSRGSGRVKMYGAGYATGVQVSNGLLDSSDLVNEAAGTMSHGVLDKAKEVLSKENDLGEIFDKTIWEQIKEGASQVTEAGKGMIKDFVSDVKGEAKKEFPSLSKTLTDNFSVVTNIITEKKDELVDEYTDYFSELGGGGIYEDVADTVNEAVDIIENGTGSINGSYDDLIEGASSTKKKIVDIDNEILSEEEEYWRTLLRIKRQGADADKYNALSVKEFEQEIFEETLDIWKGYTDRLQSTAQSVMSSHGLFEAVSKSEAKSKDELFKNLDDQIEEYRQYAETLAAVTFRLGPDSALASYLQGLGISSLEQLKVINQFTDEELTRYANLYDTKYAYATNIASQQLTDFGKETENKLADLYGALPGSVNLDEFAKNFTGSMDSITTYVNDVVLPASEQIRKEMEQMAKLLSGEVSGEFVSSELGEVLDEVYDIYAARAAEYVEDIGSNIDTSMANGLRASMASNDAAISKSDELFDVYADRASEYSDIGVNMDAGVAQGIEDSTAAQDAAMQSVTDIKDAYREAALIESPSQLMADEVGEYLAEGVAKGMTSFVAKMYLLKNILEVVSYISEKFKEQQVKFVESGKYAGMGFVNGFKQVIASSMYGNDEMADSVISTAEYAIAAVQNIIENGADEQFTITPVMNLDNIRSGVKQLNSIVSTQKGISVSSALQREQQSKAQQQSLTTDRRVGNNYTFNQYNTSPKALSTVDIYRQTKNQYSMFKEATSR